MCSLVTVDTAGKVAFEEISTSAVDWKNIDLVVESDATLNDSLQKMKSLLMQESYSRSDRIWSICWTLRGPLPVLSDFIEEDLELAVAIELEELDTDHQKIRLVHQVRTLPDPWEVPEKESLAQQYADLITEDAIVSRRKLMNFVRREKKLSDGWRQRFEALVAGVDRERILSRMRIDGAEWLVPDVHSLLPDFDDFDEDILQDEEIEGYGLTDDSESDGEESKAAPPTALTEVLEAAAEAAEEADEESIEAEAEQEDGDYDD